MVTVYADYLCSHSYHTRACGISSVRRFVPLASLSCLLLLRWLLELSVHSFSHILIFGMTFSGASAVFLTLRMDAHRETGAELIHV